MPSVSRRTFLGTAALGGAAVGTGVAGAVLAGDPGTGATPSSADGAAAQRAAAAGTAGSDAPGTVRVRPAFRGTHQAGVLAPPAPHGLLVAFRCVDEDRRALAGTFRAVSTELEALVGGHDPAPVERALPPPDNGVLDGAADTGLTAALSVGASLFDVRYGLSGRRPAELVSMPLLANDRLDPARTHGDLLLVLQAEHPDVCVHAVRRVMRRTRAGLVLHWMLAGFNRPDPVPTPGRTGTRNLLGFKDGTANPDATDARLMDELVWVPAAAGEPAWTAGGTYQAVRVIRMFVEQWDRTALAEQEGIICRHKHSGAPLGARAETDPPAFAAHPSARQVPVDAHIRLANPRTADAMRGRILRRGFSYSRGFDGAGMRDQGLAFVSYQRRLAQFLEIQGRLRREPLEEYIQPEGGGFFFVLPGVTRAGDWLGQPLLDG
jgi:deferrochelatase/peroxidase EfeB